MSKQTPAPERNGARWSPDRIPVATYRLQFNQEFGFRDAAALADYLRDLGISDLYASPLLEPRQGSTHGYDIANPARLNPALGGDEAFQALCGALNERGMGLMLDIVPNHMGVNEQTNLWWLDVLENGPSSAYAHYFDIDWSPVKRELENKVLLPVLGDQYGRVLENGELHLAFADGALSLGYYDFLLPIAPRTYQPVIELAHELALEALPAGVEPLLELQSIITAIGYLPPRTEQDPARLAERAREKEIIKRRLATLYTDEPAIAKALDDAIARYNGTVGEPRSFDLLDALIEAQPYRLAFWRVAAEEINYRRFFDINELAAIRVEEPDVFEATHALVFELIARCAPISLRIDHPDGLWNPPVYFAQLQERYQALGEGRQHLYVVAEKILAAHERLPEDWAVAGTTGYDFLNVASGLFVNQANLPAFDTMYATFTGHDEPLEELIVAKKTMIMRNSLSSELNALSRRLQRITEQNRRYRDFTLYGLSTALRAVIANMGVYRTYVTEARDVSERDQRFIEAAVAQAKRRNPEMPEALLDFIRDTLLLRNLAEFAEAEQDDVVTFVMKFQQLTGPVMAKSVEDTAFYIYNRLVALNEVGGHPEHFGSSVNEFHAHCAERAAAWPLAMNTSSTHDTKRSEDVRARINVLSELPDDWNAAVTRWMRQNERHKTTLDDGSLAPDRNDEYLLYQTLIGAWPANPLSSDEFATFRERIAAYMQKAANEAKVHTSWVNANKAYDDALQAFVAGVLDQRRNRAFLHDFQRLQRRVAFYGAFNALGQVALKLTAPGVPDLYQGNELWDYSLVDPDNRRPVDYAQRRALLDAIRHTQPSASFARELVSNAADGTLKLFVTQRALALRNAAPELFAHGKYIPLKAEGERADHVVAYARQHGEQCVIVAVPRLVVALTDDLEQAPLGPEIWGDTRITLPRGLRPASLRCLLTGARLAPKRGALPVAELIAHAPLAIVSSGITIQQPDAERRRQARNR